LGRRKLLGEKLEDCSIDELHSLEVKLEKSLYIVRGRKVSYFPSHYAKAHYASLGLNMLSCMPGPVAGRAGQKAEREGMSILACLLPHSILKHQNNHQYLTLSCSFLA
jgi:hypothetical protein